MNKLVSHIQATLKDILSELFKTEININDVSLETPPKKELGDYSFPCFGLSKSLKKGPAQIGQEIIDFVKNNEKYNIFSSLEVVGPYLNIRLDKAFLSSYFIENYTDLLNLLDKNNESKKIIIDYIGANVGKPLHIGHMCTPNQGQVFINLFEKIGYNVISDSHIGDWGIIFGKLILAYKNFGDENKLKENAVEHLFELYVKISEDVEKEKEFITEISNNAMAYFVQFGISNVKGNIFEVLNVMKENGNDEEKKIANHFLENIRQANYQNIEGIIRNEFKALSEGNQESIELWRKFTRYSIDAMNIQLGKLHIKPMYNIGESFYEGLGLPKMEEYPDLTYNMNQIVEELVKKGIATKNDDGSVGVVFSEDTKIPSCILQKRDGTHGYLASDLACVKYRMQNWNPEKIVYFVDVRQQLHLKQVFTISKMASWVDDKTELFHAYNGFISLKDGAMSTRKGRIIKLEALLDEAEDRAKKIILEKREDFSEEELKKLSKIIGIGAIKYGYLSKNRTTDVIFDWDEFMTFEGNSGPYIQYAYVRARQIIEKSGISLSSGMNVKDHLNSVITQKQSIRDSSFHSEGQSFDHDEEIDLAKELFNYKTILAETATSYYPHLICNYAYNLTKKFNSFYNKVHILSEENQDKKQLKLLLVDQFSQVLKDSFEILGIEMPEKM